MKLTVRFFALYRDQTGVSTIVLNLPKTTTVRKLLRILKNQYPSLAPSVVDIMVAVNAEYSGEDTVLSEGDEVALIPPVSGGT